MRQESLILPQPFMPPCSFISNYMFTNELEDVNRDQIHDLLGVRALFTSISRSPCRGLIAVDITKTRASTNMTNQNWHNSDLLAYYEDF